jgi:DNA repair protein RadA/Sms
LIKYKQRKKSRLLTETDVEAITMASEKESPKVMVVDSIQTMQLAEVSSAAGGVSQVRETAAYLTRYAKQNNVAIFLVGHVTKSGEVAGPRVLEHIVDTVVFLEGQSDSRFRTLRAIKNRFGAVNELGVFAMTEKGMKQVKNPSAIFLSRGEDPAPGSVVMVIWEGSRPLLVEIQALVDDSPYGAPKRVTVGLDQNRMAMLLAVMHRHGGIQASDQDVYNKKFGGYVKRT